MYNIRRQSGNTVSFIVRDLRASAENVSCINPDPAPVDSLVARRTYTKEDLTLQNTFFDITCDTHTV
jgi:hypothetical protein